MNAEPLEPSELPALAEWYVGNDTGISSKYMASVALAQQVIKSSWQDPTPYDHPDLGRCVRLIEKVPFVRNCFPILRQSSPVWATYLDHWDELTELYRKGDYHDTTALMHLIRCEAEKQTRN